MRSQLSQHKGGCIAGVYSIVALQTEGPSEVPKVGEAWSSEGLSGGY